MMEPIPVTTTSTIASFLLGVVTRLGQELIHPLEEKKFINAIVFDIATVIGAGLSHAQEPNIITPLAGGYFGADAFITYMRMLSQNRQNNQNLNT